MGLDGERPHQPQTTLTIGKDAHDMSAASDLLVQALEHVGNRYEDRGARSPGRDR
jgi:hypothetical protein